MIILKLKNGKLREIKKLKVHRGKCHLIFLWKKQTEICVNSEICTHRESKRIIEAIINYRIAT